jgi:uncharacterized membrane protein
MAGMTLYLFALLIGVVSGLRTFTAPMAVSWAANLGWLSLKGSPLGFLGAEITPYILTLAAIAELVVDQLPQAPSRKAPTGFIARIVSGAFCGTAVGLAGGGMWWAGLIAGGAGAVIGTLGGYEARTRLAKAIGRDRPAAFLEDACALAAAFLIVRWL